MPKPTMHEQVYGIFENPDYEKYGYDIMLDLSEEDIHAVCIFALNKLPRKKAKFIRDEIQKGGISIEPHLMLYLGEKGDVQHLQPKIQHDTKTNDIPSELQVTKEAQVSEILDNSNQTTTEEVPHTTAPVETQQEEVQKQEKKNVDNIHDDSGHSSMTYEQALKEGEVSKNDKNFVRLSPNKVFIHIDDDETLEEMTERIDREERTNYLLSAEDFDKMEFEFVPELRAIDISDPEQFTIPHPYHLKKGQPPEGKRTYVNYFGEGFPYEMFHDSRRTRRDPFAKRKCSETKKSCILKNYFGDETEFIYDGSQIGEIKGAYSNIEIIMGHVRVYDLINLRTHEKETDALIEGRKKLQEYIEKIHGPLYRKWIPSLPYDGKQTIELTKDNDPIQNFIDMRSCLLARDYTTAMSLNDYIQKNIGEREKGKYKDRYKKRYKKYEAAIVGSMF